MVARVAGLAVSGLFLLTACSGHGRGAQPPCFDGWTTEISGASKVVQPSKDELAKISGALGERGRLACIHQMPTGELIVLTLKRSSVLATRLELRDGAYVITEEGAVVSN